MGVIYKATCNITGKSYIGQTIDFERRKQEHLTAKDDYVFHKALRKYGSNNFSWAILEECEDTFLNERERYWISYYNTFKEGYNLTEGGDDAHALVSWIKSNPDKAKENALHGLKYAQQYNEEHREEHLKQLASARQKGVDTVKRKIKCIELNLEFDSIADAERWSQTSDNPNGKICHHQQISKVCSGQRQTTGGYHWQYI